MLLELEIFKIGLETTKLAQVGTPMGMPGPMPSHTLGYPVGQLGLKLLFFVSDVIRT